MIYPNFLKKGDIIGITALSSGITDLYDIDRLESAYNTLKNLGYKIIETDNVRKNQKFVSDTPQKRAEQFMNLWCNNEVSIIFAPTGGEFLMEILPYLNLEKMKKVKPKWIQGYSDISLLNFYLTTNLDIATVHGMNVKSFGCIPLDDICKKNISMLCGEIPLVQESFKMYEGERVQKTEKNKFASYFLTNKVCYKSLNVKKAMRGILIGGCVDVISVLLGTPFDNTKKFIEKIDEGVIWYLDNCEMNILSLYRTLWQMKQSGWFNNTNGVIIGRTMVEKEILDFNYTDVLKEIFKDLPIVYDADIGHLPPQWTIINGARGILDVESWRLEIRLV